MTARANDFVSAGCSREAGKRTTARAGIRAAADEQEGGRIDGIGADSSWEPPIPISGMAVPAFPTAMLPSDIAEFVAAESRAVQVPEDVVGVLTLAVLSAAVAGKRMIRLSESHVEPLNIYALVTSGSGTRKSTVVADVTAPLVEYEKHLMQRDAGAIARLASNYRTLEMELKSCEAKASKGDGAARGQAGELAEKLAKTRVPATPRLLADNATPERLTTLLYEQQGAIALFSAEGEIFEQAAGRYSGNGRPNFDVYLKGHAGDPLRVDRVGRTAEYVPRPSLVIGVAVQPDTLDGMTHTPGFRARGLLGRFFYSTPASLLGKRDSDPPPMCDGVRDGYHARIRGLLELPRPAQDAPCDTLTLTPEARAEFLDFSREIEPQLTEFGPLGSMTDWAGKLPGLVGRIAGILHMAEGWGCPVDDQTMTRAISLGRYALAHARSAYREMGADPALEGARRVARWVEEGAFTEFTQRECHRVLEAQFPTKDKLVPALLAIEQAGYIRAKKTEMTKGNCTGGRPRGPAFEVNPSLRKGAA